MTWKSESEDVQALKAIRASEKDGKIYAIKHAEKSKLQILRKRGRSLHGEALSLQT
jgi:hypothetical protein